MKPAYLLAISTVPTGFVLLIIFNFPKIVLTLSLFTIVGFFVVMFIITEQTLLQRCVSDEFRGRVLGAYGATEALFYIIGIGAGSILGALLGTVGALDIAAGLFVCAGLVSLLLLRGIPNSLANGASEKKEAGISDRQQGMA